MNTKQHNILPLEVILNKIIGEINTEIDGVPQYRKREFDYLRLELKEFSDADKEEGLPGILSFMEKFPIAMQYFRRGCEVPCRAMHAQKGDIIEILYVLGKEDLGENSVYNETLLLKGDGRIIVFTTGNCMTMGYFGVEDYFTGTTIDGIKKSHSSFSEENGSSRQRGGRIKYLGPNIENFATIKDTFKDYFRKILGLDEIEKQKVNPNY